MKSNPLAELAKALRGDKIWRGNPHDDGFYSVKEVAKEMNLSVDTVRKELSKKEVEMRLYKVMCGPKLHPVAHYRVRG